MNNLPPFTDQLRHDLLTGLDRHQRRRRRRSAVAAAMGFGLLIAGGFGLLMRASPATIETGVSTVTSTASTTEAEAPPSVAPVDEPTGDGQCNAAASDEWPRLEAAAERLVLAYNRHDADLVVSLIGDGQVIDPSLEVGRIEPYSSVSAWLTAAAATGDRLDVHGTGLGDTFQLYGQRSNPTLNDHGIETLSISISIRPDPDCDVRIEVGDEISAPDTCAYAELIGRDCGGPFEPRAGHNAVWTGVELLIHGGYGGTHADSALTSGLAYNPADESWRGIAPSPVPLAPWPSLDAYWTGKRMIVVGVTVDYSAGDPDGSDSNNDEAGAPIQVMSYYPAEDRWEVSDPLPEQRYVGAGATAFSGSELFVFGGSQNDPRDTAWSFDLNSNSWRQLPDPGIPEVEESAGVWTGTEAVFYGGYSGGGTAVHVAYNPTTDQWRQLPIDSGPWIESHQLIWTGDEIIVTGGNAGPAHDRALRIFDMDTETWRTSAPVPVPPTGDVAPVWTGERLLLWGGHATYGGNQVHNAGALYDPNADVWTVMAEAPLGPRCSHSGTWVGDRYVMFGGLLRCGDPGVIADGSAASYLPANDSWQLLPAGED